MELDCDKHVAGVEEIKKAFRERAKRAHPDTLGCGSRAKEPHDFVELLNAYRVLTNDNDRNLYDLSLNPKTKRIFREETFSAKEHTHHSASRGRDGRVDQEWLKADSWAAWAVAERDSLQSHSRLDRAKEELRLELRSALRHAYLGPQLDLEQGGLPECFEADERSNPVAEDVLQLVSGRTLLGRVRMREDLLFAPGSGINGRPWPPVHEKNQAGSQRHPAASRARRQRSILELLVEEQVVALGVKEISGGSNHVITTFDPRGRALSMERNGLLRKIGPVEDGVKALEAVNGRSFNKASCTHNVLRWRTSFVKHLHFLGTQGSEKVSVCRVRRAQMPPTNMWIFPPRSLDHASRSWYFEWPGPKAAEHKLWLPAAVFVLTAAFETLKEEEELAKARPQNALQRAADWAKAKMGF